MTELRESFPDVRDSLREVRRSLPEARGRVPEAPLAGWKCREPAPLLGSSRESCRVAVLEARRKEDLQYGWRLHPASDSEFQTWQTNFCEYASAHSAELGLTPAEITALTTAQTTWNTAYPAHVAAQAAAEAARTVKDAARTDFVSTVRPLAKRIQITPGVTDDMRAGLGITIPDRTPTPVGAPTTRPLAHVDTSQRFRHTVHFTDEGTPTSKARPGGVMGAEIWMKVGDPAPTGPSQLVFTALDTHTPYVLDFVDADGGKRVYYMLRWVSTRGDKGPWSETVVATIPA